MARVAKPWFRAFDGWYYAYVNGEPKRLCEGPECPTNFKKAEKVLKELREAAREFQGIPVRARKMTVAEALTLFLERCRKEVDTYDWYYERLNDASHHFGKLRVLELKVHHVDKWLDTHEWGDTSKSKAIGCLKAALNWCVKKGHIPINPIRAMEKPQCAIRPLIRVTVMRPSATA